MYLVLQQRKTPEAKRISDPIHLFNPIYVLTLKPDLVKYEIQETLHGDMVPELWNKKEIYKTKL